MKEKIAEIQKYFKDKIVNGDYEIIDICEHYPTIQIDGEYNFALWTSNEVTNIEAYMGSGKSFMKLPEFTEEEKKIIWKALEEEVKQRQAVYLKNSLQRQIIQLQSKLEQL